MTEAKLKRSSRELSSGGAAPHVVLDLDYQEGLFHLVLVNLGDSVAYDVAVEFADPLFGLEQRRPVSEMRLFKGLPLARPRHELRVFLGPRPVSRNRAEPSRFVATVTYRDRSGRAHKETFAHDMGVYRDFPEPVSLAKHGPSMVSLERS